MKHLILLFFLLVLLTSCSQTKNERTKTKDSITIDSIHSPPPILAPMDTIELQEMDSLSMSEFQSYGSQYNPVVMNDSSFLYSELKDTIIIKRRLPRFTPFTILEKGGIYTRKVKIDTTGSNVRRQIDYELKQPLLKIEVNGERGYIKAQDIAYYHIKNPNGKIHYFVNVNAFAYTEVIVYKYDDHKKMIADSLVVDMGGSDSEITPDNIQFRDDFKLRNVLGVLQLYRVDEFCGGGEFSIFVVDTKDSLSNLVRQGGWGEMCEGSSVSVGFPYVKNHDTLSAVDPKRIVLKPTILKTLKDRNIPVHQVIPKNYNYFTGEEDGYEDEGTPCKSIVTKDYTILYYWDGTRLQRLDSINHLRK